MDGRRLFPDRHAHTVAFRLNREEYDLYKAVTAYINEFLPQASGQEEAERRARRAPSSSAGWPVRRMAIYESIRRRLEKQQAISDGAGDSCHPRSEPAGLPSCRAASPTPSRTRTTSTKPSATSLTDEFTAAVELDQLRSEIAALQELLAQARRVRDQADDSKLAALQGMSGTRAEFKELSDGRGKLLIFTEHRDTLNTLAPASRNNGATHLPRSTAA